MIWYLVALPCILGLAGIHSAIDHWLLGLPRPLPRRAVVVLTTRWGFLATILIYAWLIDSRRIPYAEPGIWLLFGAGMLGSLMLGAGLALRHRLVGRRWLGLRSPSRTALGLERDNE